HISLHAIEEVESYGFRRSWIRNESFQRTDDAEFSRLEKAKTIGEGKPQARAKVAWQAMTLG
ncbi:hypothetical protein LTS06_012031, partial [Exophiala xenobiotica]